MRQLASRPQGFQYSRDLRYQSILHTRKRQTQSGFRECRLYPQSTDASLHPHLPHACAASRRQVHGQARRPLKQSIMQVTSGVHCHPNVAPQRHPERTATPRWQLAPTAVQFPTTTEELRTTCRIMTNIWLLAQMRQPGRHLFADLQTSLCNAKSVGRSGFRQSGRTVCNNEFSIKTALNRTLCLFKRPSGTHTTTQSIAWNIWVQFLRAPRDASDRVDNAELRRTIQRGHNTRSPKGAWKRTVPMAYAPMAASLRTKNWYPHEV